MAVPLPILIIPSASHLLGVWSLAARKTFPVTLSPTPGVAVGSPAAASPIVRPIWWSGPTTGDSAPRVMAVYARLARMVGWSSRPGPLVPLQLAAELMPGQTCAPLAQSAERLHGKEKVYGSIP